MRQSLCLSSAVFAGFATALIVAAGSGCTSLQSAPPPPAELYRSAVAVITEVLGTPVQPITDSTVPEETRRKAELAAFQLQAQGMEIAAEFPTLMQPVWLSDGLGSASDGVRYATLLAIGHLSEFEGGRLGKPLLGRIRQLAAESAELVQIPPGSPPRPRDEFVHMAAAFATYKLTGETQAVAFIPQLLVVRRGATADATAARIRTEAVYILSQMPRLAPRPVLEQSAVDPDPTVQAMAQNRLALLGDAKAMDAVINMTQSPLADEQIDALATLGEARMDTLDPLVVAFRSARQNEVRMAAARALGLHGDTSGQKLALQWLRYKDANRLSPADIRKDELHEYRVRILAALALGAIGDYPASAGPLLAAVRDPASRRVQLAAARAALELLKRSNRWPAP